jgi:hypothetical protein
MKKRLLLVMAVLVVVAIGLTMVVPASACCYPQGCTPGYWKQPHHLDSWEGYAPGQYFDDVFGVGPHITLLDALWARGGGENALVRHAVAALLNAAHSEVCFDAPDAQTAIGYISGHWGARWLKDFLAGHNESGCPLN